MKALVIIDAQNDFCDPKNGSLYVDHADHSMNLLNDFIRIHLKKKTFDYIITSRDAHPTNHSSFKIWPKHCVIGTRGYEYYIDVSDFNKTKWIEIFKGQEVESDQYSMFDGFSLEDNRYSFINDGITDYYFCGEALDYCVISSIIDLYNIKLRYKMNFRIHLLEQFVDCVIPERRAGILSVLTNMNIAPIKEGMLDD